MRPVVSGVPQQDAGDPQLEPQGLDVARRRSRGHPAASCSLSPIIRGIATSGALAMASTWTIPPTEYGVVCAADAPHYVAPGALHDYSMIELQGNLAVWNGDRHAVP
jgi:hypothetical protein